MTPDLRAFEQTLVGHLYAATATVNAGGPAFVDTTVDGVLRTAIRTTTPPDPYPQGWPKPFAVLRSPNHSTELADETQTTGSPAGAPNQYTLFVYMAAYVAKDEQDAEENLCKDIYSAIATYLRPASDEVSCLPDSNAIVVRVQRRPPTPNGPFVKFGSQLYIGDVIQIAISEWYQ